MRKRAPGYQEPITNNHSPGTVYVGVQPISPRTDGRHARAALLRHSPPRVVLRLRMVHDHRRRGRLWHELERRRQRHADPLGDREDAEHRLVIVEVGACSVTPRVPLALLLAEPELATNALVHPARD